MSAPRIESLEQFPDPGQPLVLAIGAFDGIHLGHRRVLETAQTLAADQHARVGVLRFHPHPARILRPESAPPLLCSEDQIHALLSEAGIDLQLRLPFTPELSALEPGAFLSLLATALPGLCGVVTGPNWRFGREGRGDTTHLREFARAQGWQTATAPDTQWNGALISSTRIRQSIVEGALRDAAAMLGHPYVLSGIVRAGKQFGRALGFPTANFIPEQEVLPPAGVYATRVQFEGHRFDGAAYLTHSPVLAEVHLLDFQGDLYRKALSVDLLDFRRPATPIANAETLRERISKDVRDVRDTLLEFPA